MFVGIGGETMYSCVVLLFVFIVETRVSHHIVSQSIQSTETDAKVTVSCVFVSAESMSCTRDT